ncbi:MAG: outer membrane protein assembly factor BamD [Bacteroidetes bacterium]|nr:outer membrane protein assembly factor BamD [Bacteroidota bacterium]
MIRYLKVILPLLVWAIIAGSCSDYQKVLKSNDYGRKLELATKLYNKKDYNKAFPLFEELVSVKRGTREAEDIYYYYCYCNYYLDDLISASYHFSQFAKTYPASQKAEETAFMSAYCYYLGSPVYSLDQSNSYKAIEELQLFINKYPNSTRIEECNTLIDKLRKKLEVKSFEKAMLYFKTTDYKAAIIALNNTLKDFPMTEYKEEILFTIMKSNFLLAENSYENKKAERYKAAIDAYNVFIDKFATGKYTSEAQSIVNKAKERYQQYSSLNK